MHSPPHACALVGPLLLGTDRLHFVAHLLPKRVAERTARHTRYDVGQDCIMKDQTGHAFKAVFSERTPLRQPLSHSAARVHRWRARVADTHRKAREGLSRVRPPVRVS